MMKRRAILLPAALALTIVTGCRATLEGKRVSTLAPDSESGITYFLTRPVFTIDVKDRNDNKEAEPVYDLKMTSVADPEKRFSVRLKGGTITKDVLNLKLRPDGTLENIGATSESQVPQLVTALGSLAASTLTFGMTGLTAAAAVLSQGTGPLDEALVEGLCSGQINAQEYANASCAAGKLLGKNPSCQADTITCKDGREISTPAPEGPAQRLENSALQRIFNMTGPLIEKTEPALWKILSQTVPDNELNQLANDVNRQAQGLQALRELEALLAARLGTDPQHGALMPPDPAMFPPGKIRQNLERLISSHIDKIEQASDAATRKNATDLLAVFAAVAEVAAPGLVDQSFNSRTGKLDKEITESFEKGELATRDLAKTAEPKLLQKYRAILALRTIRKGIQAPATPKEQIAKTLTEKKRRAEQIYAQYVSNPSLEASFTRALKDYTDALTRFLRVDDRLENTTLRDQQGILSPFITATLPPKPTGNESKAYKDYREELDRVLERINTRIGSAVDPKKSEKLPRGSQVTRTLDQVVSCALGKREQLNANQDELLLLAEMWIKYGGKESIVYRYRVRDNPQDNLDCGLTEPFGASVRAGITPPSPTTSAASSHYRVRSGMHVRRLTSADLAKPDLTLEGVLVQVPVTYDVIAVLIGPSGDRVLKAANLNLPADDEFLDLGFKGSTFRSQELSVGLHPNGSVSTYKLDSVQKFSDSAQSLADATKSVTNSLVEIQKAQPATVNPLDTQNAQLRLEILNLMLQANLEAIQQGKPLPFPDLFKS